MGEIVRKEVFLQPNTNLLSCNNLLAFIFHKSFAAIETNIISKLIMKLIPEGELFIFCVFV